VVEFNVEDEADEADEVDGADKAEGGMGVLPPQREINKLSNVGWITTAKIHDYLKGEYIRVRHASRQWVKQKTSVFFTPNRTSPCKHSVQM
jgi:hypothetical protein